MSLLRLSTTAPDRSEAEAMDSLASSNDLASALRVAISEESSSSFSLAWASWDLIVFSFELRLCVDCSVLVSVESE